MDIVTPIQSALRPTTQAAEGLPRWRWTTDELVQLKRLGVFGDMDRFELIGGEIVPMPADGRAHVTLQDALIETRVIRDPARLRVGEEKQFNLDAVTYTKPDLLVWLKGVNVYELRGPETLLVVEIAKSTLDYDLGFKRTLYAAFGVCEYWVIDVETLTTHIHTAPANGDYGVIGKLSATALLTPTLAPALAIRLADLAL